MLKNLPPHAYGVIEGLQRGLVDVSVSCLEHAGILIACAIRALNKTTLCITADASEKDRLASLVRYLCEKGDTQFHFSNWHSFLDNPYQDVVESSFMESARTGFLSSLFLRPTIAFIDAKTSALRLPPFDAFIEGILRIEVGKEIPFESLISTLTELGYHRTNNVLEIGEFAIKGGIIDIYSPFHQDPLRIEFDGDTPVSLGFFDPTNQTRQRTSTWAWIVPCFLLPNSPTLRKTALDNLKRRASEENIRMEEVRRIEEIIKEGRLPPAYPAIIPFLYERMDSFVDYLPEDAIIALIDKDKIKTYVDAELETLDLFYKDVRGKLRARPNEISMNGAEVISRYVDRSCDLFPTLLFRISESNGVLGPSRDITKSPAFLRSHNLSSPPSERIEALYGFIREATELGYRILIICPLASEAERVRTIIQARGVDSEPAISDGLLEVIGRVQGRNVRVGVGRVRHSFEVQPLNLVVIASEAVFGIKDTLGLRKSRARYLSEIKDLTVGDLVIHKEHGLGRFEGLKEIKVGNMVTELLSIAYKGGDRLLVPIDKASMVGKYVGGEKEGCKELDRLGSESFKRRKNKAKRAAREIAEKLKTIYARRMISKSYAFGPRDAELAAFEASFPFETTLDQEEAIEDVLSDMASVRPMDRLICGDVGFGKTEVAMRAAFKAVQEGKQVAVLVPTTILSEQHRLTFQARFRNTPVIIESFSRLKSGAEIKAVLERLRSGGIDIIIGTHRLLSKDVKFRDLGLLIIDEEHRFGVEQKERIREVAAYVHTLSLSATPIPRTLNMALCGIRDISIIETPPKERLAIKTFVARPSRDLIRSAILREITRGGQVFYVYNRIDDIHDVAKRLVNIVPEARVCVAHGRMSSKEITKVMTGFVQGEYNVLVCTTIIESGIDIGSANTMFISDADCMGLAQLYQLRGRVGRSTEQAYCYLLVRDPTEMTEEARKRIEAIERFSDLASGYNLAMADLQIRGAGDIFGAEQSGHIAEVGYDLFIEMISDAIKELAGEVVVEKPDVELKFELEARFPKDYIPDERERLRLYRRLSYASSIHELNQIMSEVIDRFGHLPRQSITLFDLMRIRILSKRLGLSSVIIKGKTVRFIFPRGEDKQKRRLAKIASEYGYGVKESSESYITINMPLSETLLHIEKLLMMAMQ